jgi:hypothetical protein
MSKLVRSFVLLAVVLVLLTSCLVFSDAVSSDSSTPSGNEDDVINRTYSSDPYKDEIMRLFMYSGVRVKESSIKRVSNWLEGPRFELPVQKGIAIVYFDGLRIIAVRDKSNMKYLYGGPSFY